MLSEWVLELIEQSWQKLLPDQNTFTLQPHLKIFRTSLQQ